MQRTLIASIIVVLVSAGVVAYIAISRSDFSDPVKNAEPTISSEATSVAQNLHVPWSMAFLPNGDMVATERNGNLRVFGATPVTIKIPGVVESGEGGLMGLAIHPNYASNKYIYLYFTARVSGKIINRVVRYTFDGTALTNAKILIDNIPGGETHNGGRIAFGPDKLLYVTTGDSGNANLAQDTRSLAGKILRITDEGLAVADNPFETRVYSYGHRNPQGLAWDDDGNLWETEHGRSGVQSGHDELNLIKKGGNYGWPIIQGDETRPNMETPVMHSGATTTWAPSGLAFKDGKLYFAGLKGESLYEVTVLSGTLNKLKAYFSGEYGRLRGVSVGPDGSLYVSTSNQDGRGNAKTGDDKILKINL